MWSGMDGQTVVAMDKLRVKKCLDGRLLNIIDESGVPLTIELNSLDEGDASRSIDREEHSLLFI
jgi:hypothetical protein